MALLPGQPPPQLGAAPPNLGAATQQQGNPGNMAQAISAVRNAVRMLEQALPNIPMGSPLHDDVLKVTQSLSKHMQPGEGGQGLDLQHLMQMVRSQSQQAPMGALQRMFPQRPNSPPAMPGQPPAGGAPPGGPPLMPTGGEAPPG